MKTFVPVLLFLLVFSQVEINAQTCPCKTISEQNKNENHPPPMSLSDMEIYAKQLVRGLEVSMKQVVKEGLKKTPWEEVEERYVNAILDKTVPGATIQTCAKKNGKITKIYDPMPYRSYFKRLYKQAFDSNVMSVSFETVKVQNVNKLEVSFRLRIHQKYKRDKYEDDTIKLTKVCFCPKGSSWIPYLASTWIDEDQNWKE